MAKKNEKNIYRKLEELQVVIAEKFRIEERMKDIPRDLEDKKAVLMKANKTYLELHEKCELIKNQVRDYALRLKEAEETRIEDEKKMETISLSREFDTLSKKIEEDKLNEQNLRKTLNTKKTYANELDERLSVQEEIISSQEADVNEEEVRKNELLAECEKDLAECEKKIAEMSAGIDDTVMTKFERIIKNKKDKGIVDIQGIECMGCHMTLPLQFVNDVRDASTNEENYNNASMIHFCPYCSRVLYFNENEKGNVDIDLIEAQQEESDSTAFEEAIGSDFSLDD